MGTDVYMWGMRIYNYKIEFTKLNQEVEDSDNMYGAKSQ